jgi:precorrin-4 methylase
MDVSAFAYSSTARPVMAFRASLHSVQDIVNALLPYYGPHCPVAAMDMGRLNGDACIEGTLESIAGMLAKADGFPKPLLVIR